MKPALLVLLALGACAPALAQTKSMVLPRAATALPLAPQHGRFRITITGFDVVAQTWDDAFQRDGKDDEVFLVTETRMLTLGDHPTVATLDQLRSKVMGDTNGFEDRIRAGKASEDGGLRTGDSVPAVGSNFRRGEPRPDRLPMLVWEGELGDDTPVIVVPTIWEWDGDAGPLDGLVRTLLSPLDTLGESFDAAHHDKWRQGLTGPQLRGYIPGVVARLSEVQLARNVIGEHRFQEATVVGSAGDRPIGMEMGEGSRYTFNPWVITMSRSDAAYTATHDAGSGLGVIKLPYIDGPALRGSYNLYVQVEQLP